MWSRRSSEPVIEREDIDAIGIMLMEIHAKLERVLAILEDEDGWEGEEETNGS